MTVEIPPPTWFVDPVTGNVQLRFAAIHLERLHGSYPDEAEWVEAVPGRRLPFPLLAGALPTDVVLTPDTTPADLSVLPFGRSSGTDFDGRYWFALYAVARTPFGWQAHPTMHFRTVADRPLDESPMRVVVVNRTGHSSDENFDVMDAWLRQELGAPTTSAGDNKRRRYNRSRRWTFPWGRVLLYYEPRDREAEIAVSWSADDS
ncbi:MAG TPA: hypothetical protein VNA14_11270 [Mycobacteriales bacterium]|nr:hypothetical protein [Mycobacteriales bacterium]